MHIYDFRPAVNLANHLARLNNTKVVRKLAYQHTYQILCQCDRGDVWEEQVVEGVGTAWENA